MPEQDDRLVRCFASVFPALTPEEIRAASAESVAAWDSLASVTLVAVIQQEFGVEIDILDLPELTSFEAWRTYLSPSRDARPGRGVRFNP
ncbi:MAG: acyl carrier protein [Terriglobia bacterium]|jgi:acyl carrier protein